LRGCAAREIVVHGHADLGGCVGGLVPVQRCLHQVISEETGAAGDQQILTGDAPEFLAQVVSDVIEIPAQQLVEQWQFCGHSAVFP
jgi:hypothetical protein